MRVVLADHQPRVGSGLGVHALPVIEAALAELGVESRGGLEAVAVTPEGLELRGGETIPAATVVWCAGLRAHPLTAAFGVDLDRLGRLPVENTLRVIGVPEVFDAGDVARAPIDPGHDSVMSCQHGRPMGRFAGHNVVADLLGQPLLPLHIPTYVTVVDLGPCGTLYTEGWDRQVVATGATAKATKRLINGVRIYPPAGGDRSALLAAAAPERQTAQAVAPTPTAMTEPG
ncbi:FAD-dependent oxidoreductase [Cyanobium sp. Morenito 9A2]|nr:FAD-dependent oxidoreductase [Cyanobium sp. Morenito 9A2]